jgi:hypothetical protein
MLTRFKFVIFIRLQTFVGTKLGITRQAKSKVHAY